MSYTDFLHLYASGKWETFKQGDTVQDGTRAVDYFSIIYAGLVNASTPSSNTRRPFQLVCPVVLLMMIFDVIVISLLTTQAALDCFDFVLAPEFRLDLGIDEPLTVTAVTDVILFRIPRFRVHALSKSRSLVDCMKDLILVGLSVHIRRENRGGAIPTDEIFQHPDMKPLSDDENPRKSFWQVIKDGTSVRVSFTYSHTYYCVILSHNS